MADEKMISEWMRRVSEAALSFESRWTMKALKRVNPALHGAMSEQLALYHEALLTGERGEIDTHASATIRGYRAIHEAMCNSGEPDDAYMVGFDGRTGTRVAIGDQKVCVYRVRQIHGKDVVWLTPDECAALFAQCEGFKSIAAIKNMFPGAEIIDKYPGEPAKADGLVGEVA